MSSGETSSAEGERRLRPARPADLPALVEVEQSSFEEPWTPITLASELAFPGAQLWLEEGADGRLAGYAAFRWDGFDGHLLRIAVPPALRRQGVASRLLGAGLGWLRGLGAENCHLEVRATNQPAIALYQRFGFGLAGRRSRYYSDGCDALLFSLDLARP